MGNQSDQEFEHIFERAQGGSKGGVWAPLGANPAFGPSEQGGMLGMSKLGGYESIPSDSDTLENFGFLTRV